ncbi:MAG: murein L,D-transpeptidase catalytic domain family protein [bacterium]|nr:murein L,D-transpeptidase catalytic domain family protein [bacterium]
MCISIANTGQKKRIQQKLITENSVPHSTNKQKVPITEAFQFVKQHKMDTTIAILIDYKQHSGKKRGFIIDLKLKLIRDSFLVAHGCGDNNWSMDQSKDAPKFSNAFDSHCSSLGKYKIGARAYSDWGIHVKYLLYGLETSNSNAYKRTIVLHGWESIPDIEPYPNGVPEGWGCPAVSNETMAKLDAFLSDTKRPVLLWAY